MQRFKTLGEREMQPSIYSLSIFPYKTKGTKFDLAVK